MVEQALPTARGAISSRPDRAGERSPSGDSQKLTGVMASRKKALFRTSRRFLLELAVLGSVPIRIFVISREQQKRDRNRRYR